MDLDQFYRCASNIEFWMWGQNKQTFKRNKLFQQLRVIKGGSRGVHTHKCVLVQPIATDEIFASEWIEKKKIPYKFSSSRINFLIVWLWLTPPKCCSCQSAWPAGRVEGFSWNQQHLLPIASPWLVVALIRWHRWCAPTARLSLAPHLTPRYGRPFCVAEERDERRM